MDASRSAISASGITQLREASYANGVLTLTIIQPGFNKSKSRYYPADVLRRDHKIFEGSKMFVNHQTDAEAKHRPEGRVEDWAASLTKVWAESDGRLRGNAPIIDPAFRQKVESLQEHGLLSELGVSIRAMGEGSKQKIEGVETTCVEALQKSRSVDFVTFAGAGGRVEAMEAEEISEVETEAQLRERYPSLVAIIESKSKGKTMADKTQEQLLQEAREEGAKEEKKRADKLQADLEEAQRGQRKATASTELTKLLAESKLPDVAKERVQKQFAEAEKTDGMKESIEAEQNYIKAVTGGKGVRGYGKDDNAHTDIAEVTDMKEAFMGLGLSEKEAVLAAKGW